MRIRFRGVVASVVTAGLAGAAIAAPAASADTSAPVSVVCTGASNDVAGVVSGAPKSSLELLTLAASLVKLPGLPPFPTTVTTDAPAKVAVNSGEREVTVTYHIGVPADVAALMRDQLGVPTLIAQGTTAGVEVSGPVTATVTAVAPDTTLDLNNPATEVTVSMKVKIDTARSGRIFFRPSPISMKLVVNGSVGGVATINTITLGCNAQGLIASTSVQVPGTPNVPAQIDGPDVTGGESATIPLIGRPDITPTDNNPIMWGSLRVIGGEGGARIEDGSLVQPTAIGGGTYLSEVEVCGEPRMTEDTPGVDEVQSLRFPGDYTVRSDLGWLNPHPLGMRLSFKGDQTVEIPLTTLYGTGLEGLLGKFQPPTARSIQNALEALPSIGAGNIVVKRESDGSYSFTFAGELAESDQPQIELSDWRTHLDYAVYDQIFDAISGLAGGGGGSDGGSGGAGGGGGAGDPAATDLTVDQLVAELQAGRISLEQFGAKFGNALKNTIIKSLPIPDILDTLAQIFPQKPKLTTTTEGEAKIPGSSTGPLCTSFFVKTVATASKAVHSVSARVGAPCQVTGRVVRHRIVVRRKRNGRTYIVRKTVKTVERVRRGQCAPSIVLRAGKLVVSNLPVRAARVASPPRRVTITVSARGIKRRTSRTLKISSKTGAASGVLVLPAGLGSAKRITVKAGGRGVAAQAWSILPS